MIREGGGRFGLLSRDDLQSAIGRPYSGYHRSISRKAAALLEAVIRNHGFADGNKRTAAMLVILLLERSGYHLPGLRQEQTSRDYEELIVSIANRGAGFDEAEAWFRRKIAPKP